MAQKIVEGQDAGLHKLQQRLVSGAGDALKQPTFEERNRKMSQVVADVCAPIGRTTTSYVDTGAVTERLTEIAGFSTTSDGGRGFHDIVMQAALKAGDAFRGAFDNAGNKLGDKEDVYNKAMKAAGGIAEEFLLRDVFPNRSRLEMESLLGMAGFQQAVEVVGGRLDRYGLTDRETAEGKANIEAIAHMRDNSFKAPEKIKSMLHEIAKGDYFEGNIDSMRMYANDFTEIGLLDVATRLANATWLAGQVHRAAWEGNTSRIDPEKREAFNPYDLLMLTQFRRQFEEAKGKGLSESEAREQAIARVAFEVWKDIHQYQELHR